MSSNNNGWFYTLTLKTDKNSFQEGNKAVDSVSISVTRLLGTVRNAVPLIAEGMKMINGNVADTYATGAAIGFSTQKMEAWTLAAKKAGVNTGDLFRGIKKLKDISAQVIEMGDTGALQGIAEPLAWLGITDVTDFLSKSPEEKIALVFEKARTTMTKGGHSLEYAAQNVGKILGSEYNNLFTKMQTVEGVDFFGWNNQALQDGYINDENAKKALGFNRELEDTVYLLSQIGKFAGTEFGASFTPMLKELNEFMRANKDGIKSGLKDLADALTGIANALVPILGPLVESGLKMFVDLLKALKDLLNGDWAGAGQSITVFFEDFRRGILKALGQDPDKDAIDDIIDTIYGEDAPLVKKIKDFQHRTQGYNLGDLSDAEIQEFIQLKKSDTKDLGGWGKGWTLEAARRILTDRALKNQKKQPSYEEIRSGILQKSSNENEVLENKPHASLPNLDTLAFGYGLPSGSQINAGGNTINQTININGNADPGMIRESAYDGANMGLMDAMNTAEQKMQLMVDYV